MSFKNIYLLHCKIKNKSVYAIHEDNRSVKSVKRKKKQHAEQQQTTTTTTTEERPTSHKPMIILSKLSNFLKVCVKLLD